MIRQQLRNSIVAFTVAFSLMPSFTMSGMITVNDILAPTIEPSNGESNPITRLTSRKSIYRRAISFSRAGDVKQAAALMNQIASVDRPGWAPGHLWLANAIATQQISCDSPKVHIDKHLQNAIGVIKIDSLALFTVELCKATGNESLAPSIRHQFPNVRETAADLALVGDVFRAWKNPTVSKNISERATERFQKKWTVDRTLESHEFILWTKACQNSNDYKAAVNVLSRMIKSADDKTGALQFSNRTIVRYLRKLSSSGQITPWLELVDTALTAFPSEHSICHEVARAGLDENIDFQLRQAFRKSWNSRTHLLLYRMLADVAVLRGDVSQARVDYAKLIELDKQDSNSHNNLAALLSTHEPIDLKQALALVNQAIALDSNRAEYRETKGQLLYKLNRWHDAIVELEIAIGGIENRAGIHDLLSRCYTKIGRPKIAAAHHSRAGLLTEKTYAE